MSSEDDTMINSNGLDDEENSTGAPLGPLTPSSVSLLSLPAELIVEIIDGLKPESVVNFIFALYPHLSALGFAPAMSPSRFNHIMTKVQEPASGPFNCLPAEITLQILRCLETIDLMAFVIAYYHELADERIAPRLNVEIVELLQNSVHIDDSE